MDDKFLRFAALYLILTINLQIYEKKSMFEVEMAF